ncbi:MAG: lyase family protein [Actinomycetota bacterium]|nr:lyase family protein [Actinomycetota bacterium]
MTSGLFAHTHEGGHVRQEVSGRAWLNAMLDAEAALAGACADTGTIPTEAAEAIAAACADPDPYDETRLGALAAETGNPVVGLIAAIRNAIPPKFAEHVHCGATSQDIIDTAAMLVTRRAITVLRKDLAACARATADLAAGYRDTPMVARTLMQRAVPTTFGLKAALWLGAMGAADMRLADVQERLPSQLGGAAGTLGAYPDPDTGWRISQAFAARLGLVAPRLPWHTNRYPIGDLAGALATTAGVLGKVALDLILLAQNEVAEITFAHDGRGASSAMPHKRNPVAAIAARAGAKQAPGLAATLFAAMEQEHERAAGAWQAEWPILSRLLTCTGSAAFWLRDALETIQPDEQRMAVNLAALDSTASTESAAVLVDRALADYRTTTGESDNGTNGREGTS